MEYETVSETWNQAHVLVVDDDRQILTLLQHWLTKAGYSVIACDSFESAKRQLTTRPPEVLLADVRLGLFNGLQLAILARGVGPRMITFVMSAFDDASLRREATLCGAAFLHKPFTREEVVGAVAAALSAAAALPDVTLPAPDTIETTSSGLLDPEGQQHVAGAQPKRAVPRADI
jgi:DNA-binding NtrC family response regulator